MSAEEVTIIRKSVWLDESLIRDAKTIAAREGVSVSEVLERHLRPGIAADLKRVAADLNRSVKKQPAAT